MSKPLHPQDIANLILYLQVELALLEQQPELSPQSRDHLRRCQDILRSSITTLDLHDWYRELTQAMQSQIGRLEEWF
ncbi:MAG: hypothetical protein Q6K99_00395 [Thermostichales cyanobacterium BF4_bins_65]